MNAPIYFIFEELEWSRQHTAFCSQIYVREWVIAQARGQIQLDFNTRVATRKATHASYLASLPYYNLYVQYSGRPPLHPPQLAQLQAQIHEASIDLRRGIDGDWRAAVQRYPDVLDYYYSLVDIRVTGDSSELYSPNAVQGKIKQRSRRNSDLPSRPSGKRRDSRTLSIGGKPKAPPMAPLPPLVSHPPAPIPQSYSRGGAYYGY